ncbi:hypothetical protein PVAG01_02082 [Phlyctema vagabunda]|uniref:Uncharacterized protein n=1 Tax=Phlyctema vagabunda TaxID=108571 RepID=A0ABR4PPS9_9HELO
MNQAFAEHMCQGLGKRLVSLPSLSSAAELQVAQQLHCTQGQGRGGDSVCLGFDEEKKKRKKKERAYAFACSCNTDVRHDHGPLGKGKGSREVRRWGILYGSVLVSTP